MHRIATYWVSVCIAVHTFAFRIEREEHGDDDESHLDPFVEEGYTSSSSSSTSVSDSQGTDSDCTQGQPTQGRSSLLGVAKNFRTVEQTQGQRQTGLSGPTSKVTLMKAVDELVWANSQMLGCRGIFTEGLLQPLEFDVAVRGPKTG